MNKKKWLIGLAVAVVLLTVTFFIGGQDKVVPLDQALQQQDSTASLETKSDSTITTDDLVDPQVEQLISDSSDSDIGDPVDTGGRDATEQGEATEPAVTEPDTAPEVPADSEPVDQQTVPNPQEVTTDTPSDDQQVKEPVAVIPSPSNPVENAPSPSSEVPATPAKTEEPKQEPPVDKVEQPAQQDAYLTDPIPAGKPEPVEWQDVTVDASTTYTASLRVSAETILNNMHLFNEDKLEVLPEDGVIYAKQTVTFSEGESVFDVLLREMKNNKIHMEFVMTPIYNSHYIEGINNLYEFDCGELSGWMYQVNGWFPNYGASRYQLEQGDEIAWMYTCDLGRDIGGYGATNGR